MDLLSIGDVNIKTIIKTSLKRGDLNLIEELSERYSSPCLSVSINTKILSKKTGIVASIGRDAYSLIEILKRHGVDYSNLILSDGKSGLELKLKTPNYTYSLFFKGANTELSFEKIYKDYLKKTKSIFLSTEREDLASKIVDFCKRHKIVTFSDHDFPVDFLVCNEQGENAKTSLIFDPKKGCKITDEEEKIIPPFPSRKFEMEGVKEAFISGFLSRFIDTGDLERSVLFGNATAYFCLQSKGSILKASLREIEKLVKGE
ncbi:MAG: carbohydrate kinase family protein [Candidatus Methanofastidiosia archaeon]